jgi:N-acetylglutamate synthase-like GNAT family acetyltransferase
MLGVCVWQVKERGLYFGRLSVAAEARGAGIAKALLAAAEAEARRRGLPRLLLSTRLPLVDNRRLFASVGFTEVTSHAHERVQREDVCGYGARVGLKEESLFLKKRSEKLLSNSIVHGDTVVPHAR